MLDSNQLYKMKEEIENSQQSNEEVCSMEMPKYRCHKEVWALKIKEIELEKSSKECESTGGAFIVPENKDYRKIYVGKRYLEKHNPSVGGYYVRYKDGYESYSPADVFEEGYTLINI